MYIEDDIILPSTEFELIIGFETREVRELLRIWPNIDIEERLIYAILKSIVRDVLGFSHGNSEIIFDNISFIRENIEMIAKKSTRK